MNIVQEPEYWLRLQKVHKLFTDALNEQENLTIESISYPTQPEQGLIIFVYKSHEKLEMIKARILRLAAKYPPVRISGILYRPDHPMGS